MTLVDNQLFDGEEQESTKMVQLSLMAYFDDMCRYQNYLTLHNDLAKLLQICNQFKSKWSKTAKELKNARQQIDELTAENRRLEKDVQFFKDKFVEKSNYCEKINKELADLRLKVKEFANVVNSADFVMDKNNLMKSKSVDKENEELLSRLNRLRCVHDDYDDRTNGNDDKINNHRAKLEAIVEEEEPRNKRIDTTNEEKTLVPPPSPNSSDLTIDVSEVDEPAVASLKPCDNDIKTMAKKLRTKVHKNVMEIDDEMFKHSITNGHSLRRFAHLLHPSPPSREQHLSKISATNNHMSLSSSHEHHWESNRSTSHRMFICAICNDRIGFYNTYFSCDGCDARAHDNCVHNPSKRDSRTMIDFVRSPLCESPSSGVEALVPTLLVRCCSEIEIRGLRMTNIYGHIHSNSSHIQNLMLDLLYPKNGFNDQHKFSVIDIDSLCNIVIYFLGYLIDLGDPLIPEFLFEDLINLNIDMNQSDKNLKIIDSIICQLPSCNRDTLAFLLIHLRKVAKNQHYNNMSLDKLARIFAPKIFHPSFPTAMQERIMLVLLSVSSDFWTNILSQDTPSSSMMTIIF
ncbi:Rho GTPase-activating protein-like protein [Euroglyphus maynei]|uniref:Rho GTPase-activating protein-like protein n=1 Tax=Euroglyphus maynei TaxID=6958 RepID=A0A1Y3B5T3_EURMA|nr:Rho GTPase-activating protein-like protein [Euroglyphus maynei]